MLMSKLPSSTGWLLAVPAYSPGPGKGGVWML